MWNHPGIRKIVKSRGKFRTIIKQISLLTHWVIESSHSCLTEFPVFQTIIKQISPLNHWVIRSSHSYLTNFFDIYLFADTDVSLPDENTGMMDWLCKSKLEHLGLETSFQEILNFEAEHIIEFHTVFIQNTNSYKATQKCVSFEKPAYLFIFILWYYCSFIWFSFVVGTDFWDIFKFFSYEMQS